MIVPAPASALQQQHGTVDATNDEWRPPPPEARSLPTTQPGRTAGTATGTVGQRQTRDRAAPQISVAPMARVSNRIQNRVQARLRNRIDRFYDPRANAILPFTVASDQARNTGQPPRR